MPQTELCSAHIAGLERPQQLTSVKTQPTEQVLDNLVRFAVDSWNGCLDGTRQVLVCDSQNNPLLLPPLREVDFQERQKVGACNALGDVICVLECLSGAPTDRLAIGIRLLWRENNELEGRKRDQFDHLFKSPQVVGGLLNFLQAAANSIGLLDNLEQAVADRSLQQKIIDSRHFRERWRRVVW